MIYIVPSRGRPHKIVELIEAWETTRTEAKLLIIVDADDPTEPEYRKVACETPPWVNWLLGGTGGVGMVPPLNFAANHFVSKHAIIGFMGDDHRPRTPSWDRMIQGAFDDGALMAYGNDLLQGQVLPTAVAMDSRIIKRLGYMAPPTLHHLYVDNFWRTLGEKIGRLAYLPGCIIEHMHPVAGKAPWDAEYTRVNDGGLYQQDHNAYWHYIQAQLDADLEKLGDL